jgi:hypothetical protein
VVAGRVEGGDGSSNGDSFPGADIASDDTERRFLNTETDPGNGFGVYVAGEEFFPIVWRLCSSVPACIGGNPPGPEMQVPYRRAKQVRKRNFPTSPEIDTRARFTSQQNLFRVSANSTKRHGGNAAHDRVPQRRSLRQPDGTPRCAFSPRSKKQVHPLRMSWILFALVASRSHVHRCSEDVQSANDPSTGVHAFR